MITISKEVEFDAGHRVPGHASKCHNPHGHRYRVRVTCQGQIIETKGAPDEGMLVDFGDLKTLMTERVHDVLDHGFIVHEADTLMLHALTLRDPNTNVGPNWKVIRFPYVPTAENLARWIWDQLEDPIASRWYSDTLSLRRVEVWETPTSVATVERDADPVRPSWDTTLNISAPSLDPEKLVRDGLDYIRRRYGRAG